MAKSQITGCFNLGTKALESLWYYYGFFFSSWFKFIGCCLSNAEGIGLLWISDISTYRGHVLCLHTLRQYRIHRNLGRPNQLQHVYTGEELAGPQGSQLHLSQAGLLSCKLTPSCWATDTSGWKIPYCFVKQLEIWIFRWGSKSVCKWNCRRPWELNIPIVKPLAQISLRFTKVLGQMATFNNFTFHLQACNLT